MQKMEITKRANSGGCGWTAKKKCQMRGGTKTRSQLLVTSAVPASSCTHAGSEGCQGAKHQPSSAMPIFGSSSSHLSLSRDDREKPFRTSPPRHRRWRRVSRAWSLAQGDRPIILVCQIMLHNIFWLFATGGDSEFVQRRGEERRHNYVIITLANTRMVQKK